ncbi:hypothetical protein LSCM1_03664 [Leishmania martiniquensis]|uniref:Sulfhydryl oxidase n=1 Tax=Leishmania martiniquensis TaxID=1580590 RepID=A0A836KIV1_9TRYP|nr:hypothetical protein LSCM1_03664 [Leishmania martiniquensis]
MASLQRFAVIALCITSLGLLSSFTVAALESHSLYGEALEVVDVSSTSLRALHESAHVCPWILVAYSGGCGHCRVSAPSIARIAKETLEDVGDALNEVTVAALNCEASTEECRMLGVQGVPSFYLLLPSDVLVTEPSLVPVVVNRNDINPGDAEARPITMNRVFIGQGATPNLHFNAARKMWGDASRNQWGETNKERCLHMRTYLRKLKKSEAEEGGTRDSSRAAGFVEDTRFQMVDVANAFFETLYHEVALLGLESAARRRALFQFLRAVQQRLPGLGADVLMHSLTANRSFEGGRRSRGGFAFVSVGDWQRLVLSAGIPYQGAPRDLKWRTCKGSSWRYRGFPCGMWLLYHALTVNEVPIDMRVLETETVESDNEHNANVLFTILDYARNFFACDVCLANFRRFEPEKGRDPVLQLWSFHNEVNRRLAEVKEGADPLVPKKIFPTAEQCPSCIHDVITNDEEDRFVVTEVSKFLRSRYKWNPTELYESTVTVTGYTTKQVSSNRGEPITVYRNPFSTNVFLTIFLVVVTAMLGMVYVLRRARSSNVRRRRHILPLRGKC